MTLLGIWAHPDDECYLSAGLMASTVERGERVVCVTATRGEAGVTDETRWPAADLGAIREAELAVSLAHLGVREHHWLDVPDGGCEAADPEPIVERLAALIGEVQPSVVVTFGPDGITDHPDHKAVSHWTTEAFSVAAPAGAQLWYPTYSVEWEARWGDELRALGVYPEGLPPVTEPSRLAHSIVLPDALLKRKYEALLAQESQVEGLIAALTPEGYRDFLREECFRFP